jgi:glucose 1-dehydrogenase/3-oxoacyl-[acyl-carrier protein] reductase
MRRTEATMESTGGGPLAGRLALVTGAGVGIGQGIAEELARQGAAVVLHYAHSAAGAQRSADEINASGGRALALSADLRSVEECRRVVAEAASFLGGLDVLVNNSGVTARASLARITPELFDDTFAVNVRSHLFCAQAAVPLMVTRGRGSIVNLSSVHAWGGVPSYAVYAATKGAVVALTRQLAIELAPQRIRVNAIGPGHVEVDRHRSNPYYARDEVEKGIPWGRVGAPRDIARLAAFLVSDAADFITGQMIYADGGSTARLPIVASRVPGVE